MCTRVKAFVAYLGGREFEPLLVSRSVGRAYGVLMCIADAG